MKNRRYLQAGSLHIILFGIAMIITLTLLSWVFWQKLDTDQHSQDGTVESAASPQDQKLVLPYWDVQLPLPDTASSFTTDSYSFSGNPTGGGISSYGISIEGGSGCIATPDYIASIVRVQSSKIITKPESPLANTRYLDGYYGRTWSQYYREKLVDNKDGAGLVKGVKELDGHTYVLQYLPSKCAAPESSTDEGRKINQLRDERAAELRSFFDSLELSGQKQT